MDHEESDEFSSEYVMPLRDEGKQRDFMIEPPRRSRFDEEDPVSSQAPKQPGKPATQAPHYPRRIPPLHEDEEQLSSVQRDSFSRNDPFLSLSKSDSFSQSSREFLEKPSVGHESVATNYEYQESPRKRLMFDGSIQEIPSSLERMKREEEARISTGTMLQDDTIEPIKCWNITLPLCLSRLIKQPPSLSRISVFIVQVAPCFWCCGSSIHSGSTDRAVLTRLNMLCLFFTFFQLFAVAWFVVLLFISDDEPGAIERFDSNLWNLNSLTFAVGSLAFIIIIICFCTIRVIREVDLVGAIRYFWAMAWIVPFEVFFNISLFDYHQVTSVWIRHWWMRPQLSWFRGYFCPDGTKDSLCAVPILGGEYGDEEAWCQAEFNATGCAEIRDEAQNQMNVSMITYYTSLGAWGCLLLIIMLLMVNSLQRIISKPIVQKSRETNVPAWLLLPTVGNTLAGVLFLFSPSSLLSSRFGAGNSWIGFVYLVTAGLFFIAMMTGWFLSAFSIQDNIDKRKKNIAVVVFIGVMATNTVLLATLFVASLFFSAELVESPIDESDRGSIACYVDGGGTCSQCDESIDGNRCPEWTLDEVTNILQTQLKQSATIAAIFFLYSISVLRFGFVLRKHLSMYQIDYV